MTSLRKQETAIVSLAILFTLSFAGAAGTAASRDAPRPLAGSLTVSPLLAQAASSIAFPLPTNVPVGTSIRIGGSSSMETINQALKQRFEQQFVGTKVVLNTQGTGPAIKDLLDGNADLAAIGRTLMEQEKAQGLVPVPVSRHKIAIIVGSENPFKGSLTFEQFAKIFRGEIKDWSQIGGEPGPIRFIDRPDNSDTRQSFRNYPIFKQAPFSTGKTAQQLAQDSTSQVVQALRTDGIGYAIADQLQGRGDVRVLPMHKTLPDNPKYPFSQPLIYVYKGPQPNPSAQAFLGYATAPVSRQTIETARQEATAAITNPNLTAPSSKVTIPSPQAVSPPAITAPQTASPSPRADPDAADKPASWLWLLAIPLLGGLFWWLLKRNAEREFEPEVAADRGDVLPDPTVGPGAIVEPTRTVETMPAVEPMPALESIVPIASMVAPLLGASQPAGNSRLILMPRDCMNADAYWDIPTDAQALLQQQGAQKLVLRLYDVTSIDINHQPPESLQEFDCDAQAHTRQLPIRTADRLYLAELGYIADDGRWLQVARSKPVHVPACPAAPPAIAPDIAALVDDAIVDQQPATPVDDAIKRDRETLAGDAALANGTVMADGTATATVLAADRSDLYVSTETTSTENSQRSRLPHDGIALEAAGAALAGSGLVGMGVVAAPLRLGEAANGRMRDRPSERSRAELAVETPETVFSASPSSTSPSSTNTFSTNTIAEGSPAMSQQTSQSQIRLVPRTAQTLYVSWDINQSEKDALKQQGGQHLVLRVYAVTGDDPSAHNVQQCFCNDWDHDQSVPIAVSNLDYVAELGYTMLDGRFLMLARSPQTRVSGA